MAGRLITKNLNDPVGNQIRDPPASSAVPQPNVPPRAPNEDTNILVYEAVHITKVPDVSE